MGLADSNKGQIQFSVKKLLFLIRNSRQDSEGISLWLEYPSADLDTLQTWERLWDMDFNQSKCQVLHISKSRHPAQHIYTLHGQALEAMDHAKYLGVDNSKEVS